MLVGAPGAPFLSTFEVRRPGGDRAAGSLASAPSGALARAPAKLERVFALGPAFRGEPEGAPNVLEEFHYLELRGAGSLADARRAADALLRYVARQVASRKGGLASSRVEALRKFTRRRGPLPSLTLAEARERTGTTDGPLAVQEALELVKDGVPVVVTGLDDAAQPGWADVKRERDGTMRAFELLAPFAGELVVGGELDANAASIERRLEAFAAQLKAGGLDVKELAAALAGPRGRGARFFVGVGIERLAQFLLGAREIEAASLFPVGPGGVGLDALVGWDMNPH